jgi:uncharacterized protein (TIGR02611 family)
MERLRRQRERHRLRGRVYRITFVMAGFTVLATGVALLVLPGPGLLVIALGLAMLALEFAWAERWLERTLDRLERIKDAAQRRARGERS